MKKNLLVNNNNNKIKNLPKKEMRIVELHAT